MVDTVASADVEIRVTKNLGYDLRYQFRRINDELDDAQDGTSQIALPPCRGNGNGGVCER